MKRQTRSTTKSVEPKNDDDMPVDPPPAAKRTRTKKEKPTSQPAAETLTSDSLSSTNTSPPPSTTFVPSVIPSSDQPILTKFLQFLQPIHQKGAEGETLQDVLSRHKTCFEGLSRWLLNIPDSSSTDQPVVKLYIGGVAHFFEELEFYFTSPEHHDPFTHCDPVQHHPALFYFHKMGNGYKGGSFKGMDISTGADNIRMGGLLVRSIRRLDTNELICGPSLTVDHMISLCHASGVQNLVEGVFQNDISVDYKTGKLMYIVEEPLSSTSSSSSSSSTVAAEDASAKKKKATKASGPVKSISDRKIFYSPRVGLYLTKKDVDEKLQKQYVYLMYRSFTSPVEITKGRSLMVVSKLAQMLHSSTPLFGGKKFSELDEQQQIDQLVKELSLTQSTIKNVVTTFHDIKEREEQKNEGGGSTERKPSSSLWMGQSNLSQEEITKCFTVHFVEGFVFLG